MPIPGSSWIDARRLGWLRAASIVAATLLGAGCASRAGLRPPSVDGCSLYPDRAIFGRTDWCSCCEAHDLAYWKGGTRSERRSADHNLEECVAAATGSHFRSSTMLLGVMIGGNPYIPTPFRWAFGWPYGRGYRALTAEERAQAQRLEAEYLAPGKPSFCKE